MLLLAARRKGGRGRRISSQNYRKVLIQKDLSLTTLASKKPFSTALIDAATDKVKVSSVMVNMVWDDMTGLAGTANEDGPLLVGVAHSGYTNDQIEEFIEGSTSMDFANKLAAERSRRLIRLVGTLSAMQNSVPANGGFKKVKLNWTLGEGEKVNFFAYNTGGSALTTGSQLIASGHANVWRR